MLNAAVLALYAARPIATFREAAPRAFLDVIPADYFVMSEYVIDRRERRVRFRLAWESRPRFSGETMAGLERILYDHPFMQHVLRHGDTGAMMLSDFLTPAGMRRSALHRDFLGPAGVRHVLGTVAIVPRGIVSLTMTRPPGTRGFSERDRSAFNLLRPHFEQARARLEREEHVRTEELPAVASYALTARESEVARWLARGRSNSEIATALRIEVRTVEKHLERLYDKLGVENRTTAALLLASSILD